MGHKRGGITDTEKVLFDEKDTLAVSLMPTHFSRQSNRMINYVNTQLRSRIIPIKHKK